MYNCIGQTMAQCRYRKICVFKLFTSPREWAVSLSTQPGPEHRERTTHSRETWSFLEPLSQPPVTSSHLSRDTYQCICHASSCTHSALDCFVHRLNVFGEKTVTQSNCHREILCWKNKLTNFQGDSVVLCPWGQTCNGDLFRPLVGSLILYMDLSLVILDWCSEGTSRDLFPAGGGSPKYTSPIGTSSCVH